MNLPELIQTIIEAKSGNREMAMSYHPDASEGWQWLAEIGNPVDCVNLGEISGEFRGYGNSLEQALKNLLTTLQ